MADTKQPVRYLQGCELGGVLAFIRARAAEGHSTRYIASGLNLAKVPTLSGRRGSVWNGRQVWQLCKDHGIAPGYSAISSRIASLKAVGMEHAADLLQNSEASTS